MTATADARAAAPSRAVLHTATSRVGVAAVATLAVVPVVVGVARGSASAALTLAAVVVVLAVLAAVQRGALRARLIVLALVAFGVVLTAAHSDWPAVADGAGQVVAVGLTVTPYLSRRRAAPPES